MAWSAVPMPVRAALLISMLGCAAPGRTRTEVPAPAAIGGMPEVSDSLGTFATPVRAGGPPGERRYLARLRCPDGLAPWFERAGSTGAGTDGHVLDVYGVRCDGDAREHRVYLDMYHDGFQETRPVAGFAIVPAAVGADELRQAARRGAPCPPLNAATDSVGRPAFFEFQLEAPAVLSNATAAPEDSLQAPGWGVVQLVVDTLGRPEPETIVVVEPDSGVTVSPALRTAVQELRFSAPRARAGCAVRQYVQLPMRVR